MFLAVDVDGSGEIDYSEFVMATMNEKELITNEKLKAAFKVFDRDSNGTIGPGEIKKVLGLNCENTEIDRMINEIDENGDGEIGFNEFCNMMKTLATS